MKFKKIYNNEKSKEKIVFLELSLEQLENILKKEKDKHIIIKFGATWCGPCKKVEPFLNQCLLEMPDNIYCFDLDVDDDLEIFGKLQTKKMIKTIPSIIYYNCSKNRDDKWYLYDSIVSSSNNNDVFNFFKNININ